jgi:hypothetical protein
MANSRDNLDGVKASADSIQPDIGIEASTGFQPAVRAYQGPYTRSSHLEEQQLANRRAKVVDGGGFQTATKLNPEPYLASLRPPDNE